MGLGFWSWNFQSMNFNSAALLSTEFPIFKRGKMTNLKIPWALFFFKAKFNLDFNKII